MPVAIALGAVVVAIGLVRIGWSRRRGVAVAGWLVAAAALVALASAAGAWGLAVGFLAAAGTALVLVLHAGWVSPGRERRAERVADAVDRRFDACDLARRIAVFVLVVPVAFVAAQWLAFGAQAAARRGGWGEADAVVLIFYAQPIAWAVVMAVQMLQPGLLRMVAPPVVAALLGTLLWAAS